ncbi:MAG: hypothetical protein NTY39_06605 [Campylobacterales bacterium]|nr:hypothetical protein [Campylobacterales bacterium]
MLAWLFQKIFIAIVPAQEGHEVVVLTVKNKKIINSVRHHFEGDTSSIAMNNFIQENINLSPFFYISVLNLYPNQGAYDGCTKQNDKTAGIQVLCRDKQWTQYASKDDLSQLETSYSSVGLDFIFSPFSLIEYYFTDKIKGGLALYAFGMPNLFAVAIFDGGKLEYGYHYTHTQSDLIEAEEDAEALEFGSPILEEEGEDSVVRLDDLDLMDDLDSLGDLADLDELDELSDMSEFSEDSLTPEEKRIDKDNGMVLIKGELDRSNEEYQRFEWIQKTLERFYASEQCQNRFIETVCIADSGSGGDELKRYLEEELFLNVLIRHVDVGEGINALAQLEEAAL